jgi:hypothetical protein
LFRRAWARIGWDEAPRLATAAIIVAGAGACLGLNLPGHLSYDSVVQLAEGRSAVYSGAHPPVMSWLLGVLDSVRPGAALFVVFNAFLLNGALLGFVLLGAKPSWLTVLAAAACACLPQLLIYPAIVWKDVLFAASASAGFACVGWAATGWAARSRRRLLLTAGLLLLTLAALARQNGAVVLPCAAAAVGWIAARAGGGARRGWAKGLGFLAAGAALQLAAAAALDVRREGPPALSGQWESLQAYDVAGAVARDPALDLRVLHARAPWLEALFRAKGAAAYSPIRIDPLEPVLSRLDDRGEAASVIAAQWRELILRHPLLYLRVRAAAFGWVLLTPRPAACVLIYTGVDGPAEEMADAGLSPRETERDDALADYAFAFASSPVYSHAAFGAVGLILLTALLRRRRPADIAVAAMLASAFAFAASFAVISIACDYRYLYDLDFSVIAAALYVAASTDGSAPRGLMRFRRLGLPRDPSAHRPDPDRSG